MDADKKITTLAEIGEFALIDRLTKDVNIQNKSTIKGVGDDAAILDYKDKQLVITTDMLMEGIHFSLVYAPLKHLGYKAAVVNFSDVYAMNAHPKQLIVSLAISSKFSVEAVEEIYEGIKLACNKYQADLIGGDTTSSLTGLALSLTAIGETKKGQTAFRNTAKKNDLICVSGNLGAAYVGLQLLEREKKVFAESNVQPDFSGYEYILERQLKPEARKDVVEALQKDGIKPTSMIDVSDGLSSELFHICTQSGVGCRIYSEKIPIHTQTAKMADEFNMDPLVCALNGGEDYELLFTVPVKQFEKIDKVEDVSIIGHITDKTEGLKLQTASDHLVDLKAQGWTSFADHQEENADSK